MKKTIKKLRIGMTGLLCFGLVMSSLPLTHAKEINKNDLSDINSKTIVKELSELREEYTKHFLNSDGTITAVTYDEPVHYLTENKKWQDIDNTLIQEDMNYSLDSTKEKSNNNYIKLADNNLLDVKFNKLANEKDLLNINIDKNYIKIGINDSKKENAIIGKANAKNENQFALSNIKSNLEYKNIFDSSDLLFEINSDDLLTKIIFNEKPTSNIIKFNIDTDLIAKQNEHKMVEFYKDNEIVYILQLPYLYDSAEKSQINDEVQVELTESTSGYTLEYKIDEEWLNNEERVYPITYQASQTVTNGRARQNVLDTYVHPGDKAGDHVNQDRLYIGNREGGSNVLINWNSFPSISGTINSASFSFNFWKGTSSWGPLSVWRIRHSWSTSTVSYNNHIDLGIELINDNLQPTYRNGYQNFSVDITDTARGWYDGRYGRNGFLVTYTNSNYNDYNSIVSSDSGLNSDYWPCFYINYTPTSSPTTSYESLGWAYPLPSSFTNITQEMKNTGNKLTSHAGIDISSSGIAGQPVYAAQNGTVMGSFWSDSGGWMLVIKSDDTNPYNGNPIYYNYMHLNSKSNKVAGNRVTKGETVGYVGNTGDSTGYHLHFETFSPSNFSTSAMGAKNYLSDLINPREFYSII